MTTLKDKLPPVSQLGPFIALAIACTLGAGDFFHEGDLLGRFGDAGPNPFLRAALERAQRGVLPRFAAWARQAVAQRGVQHVAARVAAAERGGQ